MLVLITYDVNTQTPAGQRRLRQVAKACENYGQRVQNSVFECVLDAAHLREVQHKLEGMIDPKLDSLRFYTLKDKDRCHAVHIGVKPVFDLEGTIVV